MEMSAKTAVVAGATGLTGMALTREILSRDVFSKVKLITRREIAVSDPRIEQILISSVDEIQSEDQRFSGHIYFCCLGTTIKKAGSREAFRKIDFDGVINVAKVAKTFGAKKFIMVSAVGAATDSLIFYSRVKGEAENGVIHLGIPGTCIFRPSLLIGDRSEYRFLEHQSIRLMRKIENLVPLTLRKKMATNIDRLAFRMVEEAMTSETDLKIIEAAQI
ncbi:MAG: hypothetical protein RJB66_520 [Pseudomonadota bacterium]|jgi:uncharacterized protein YbjT (DUF2867 family)